MLRNHIGHDEEIVSAISAMNGSVAWCSPRKLPGHRLGPWQSGDQRCGAARQPWASRALSVITEQLRERRERVFLVLAAVFLGAMTLLNVVGITRFIQLGPLALAVGVLPYPLTFLCTDLISELYGRARANFLVSVGLGLNFLILALTLGDIAPSVPADTMPPWQMIQLAEPLALPNGQPWRDRSVCSN